MGPPTEKTMADSHKIEARRATRWSR